MAHRRLFPGLLRLTLFGVGMVALTLLGYVLHYSPRSESVATCWPASGLLLAALIVAPVRWWLVYLLISLVAWIVSDRIVLLRASDFDATAAGWNLFGFIAAAVEALVGAGVIRALFGRKVDIGRPACVLALVLVSVFGATALAAALGAGGVVASNPGVPFWRVWQVWWFADALGILVVTPFVLAVTQPFTTPTHSSRWLHLVEAAGLIALLAASVHVAFGAPHDAMTSITDFPYVVLPGLIWAALRFGRRLVTACLAIVALGAALYSDAGYGPFVVTGPSALTNVIALQLFVSMTTVSILFLSSAVLAGRDGRIRLQVELAVRREHEQQLQTLLDETNHRVRNNLSMLVALAGMGRADPDAAGRLEQRVQTMARVHTVLSRSRWKPAGLREIVDAALAAVVGDPGRVTVDGPPVTLAAEMCQSFALILHELAVHTQRNGALAGPESRVRLEWEEAGPHRVIVHWRVDLPADPRPVSSETQADGLSIARGLVEHDLRGRFACEERDDCLHCTIDMATVRESPVGSAAPAG